MWRYNSGWRTQDFYTKSQIDDLLGEKLSLDQSTFQTISSGSPLFLDGISFGNSSSYVRLNGESLELYVNGALRQTWTTALTTAAPVYIADGTPMGLLLALTYQT